MSTAISKIENVIDSLPVNDIAIGKKYLTKRDFESLEELIDSAIIRTKRDLRTATPREEYINVNLDRLATLKALVDNYVMQLELPEFENDDESDE